VSHAAPVMQVDGGGAGQSGSRETTKQCPRSSASQRTRPVVHGSPVSHAASSTHVAGGTAGHPASRVTARQCARPSASHRISPVKQGSPVSHTAPATHGETGRGGPGQAATMAPTTMATVTLATRRRSRDRSMAPPLPPSIAGGGRGVDKTLHRETRRVERVRVLEPAAAPSTATSPAGTRRALSSPPALDPGARPRGADLPASCVLDGLRRLRVGWHLSRTLARRLCQPMLPSSRTCQVSPACSSLARSPTPLRSVSWSLKMLQFW
jgi:hypothetical protein